MPRLDHVLQSKLTDIENRALTRQLHPTHGLNNSRVARNGRVLINFSGNDYLGLGGHPLVRKAAADAAMEWGAGSGGSRLVTGSYPLLHDFEEKIAAFKGNEAALLFGSGYLANAGAIAALATAGDLIIMDELAHASMHAGCRLSQARAMIFRHNDLDHLEDLLGSLRGSYRNVLVMTEGVFSMDGDRAPVKELLALANAHDAWLMVDDAHGLGVIEDGRGAGYHEGEKLDVPIMMGTLSKALGSYGGVVSGSSTLIDFLINRARALIYTTSPSAPAIAAAMKALDIINDTPFLPQSPMTKAKIFTEALGLPDPQSAIVPIILGNEKRALHAQSVLEDEGFLVGAMRPPTVPHGTSRLRITFNAQIGDEDVIALAHTINKKGLLP